MKDLAGKFLTSAEQAKVTQTVQQAELQTSGEIVPMIVSYSHDYPKARLIAAFLYSLPMSFICAHLLSAYLWIDPLNVYFFFFLWLPFFGLSSAIISVYPKLFRIFISAEDMAIEVEEEAVKSFFTERLYKTEGANGILLFVSVFEKKAWILADHGINEKIDPGQWQGIIDALIVAIAKGDRCGGLCDAITQTGNILADHFPYQRNDTDELHNLIIKE